MKIFKAKQLETHFCITIKKAGFKNETVTLEDATLQQVFRFISDLAKTFDSTDPLIKADRFTSVQIRERKDRVFGKTITVRCKGTNPYKFMTLLKESVR
jgi:hypothetical protein